MKDNEFQCADCGGIFKKGVPEKVAWREYDDNFPGASHQIAEIVCEDCYQKMIEIEPPPGMKEQQETDALKLAQMAAFPPVAIERRDNYDWFHLKLNKPWWWKLLHPIKTRTIKKWMRETEPVMKQELEKMNFNKMIENTLYQQLCYGTSAILINGEVYGRSPLYAAMDTIRQMGTRQMVAAHWEEVCKDILKTSPPRIQPINVAIPDHLPVKPWSLKMDTKEKP